jgi:DNA-binding MarR family transcriptional regulator
MADELTADERRTTRELHRFKTEILDVMAEHFGGHATLNHLRVGSYLGLRSQHDGEPTSNAEIAAALGISRPTVSRIVADFVQAGWVKEYPHPEDGRRRLLAITPEHAAGDRFEREFRRRINRLIRGYLAGEFVIVSSRKKSF